MPKINNGIGVVRLFKRGYYTGHDNLPPHDPNNPPLILPVFADPFDTPCLDEKTVLLYNNKYYPCDEREIIEYRRQSPGTGYHVVHKRVRLTFNANGGSGGSSQVRTWGTENVVQPPTPTRSGYDFLGWSTTPNGAVNVTFPFIAPRNDTTYYARWTETIIRTATPTVGTPSCYIIGGTNTLIVSIKNNDILPVVVRRNGVIIGGLNPGVAENFTVDTNFSIPGYNYSFSITTEANGKSLSNSVSRSGSIFFCSLED